MFGSSPRNANSARRAGDHRPVPFSEFGVGLRGASRGTARQAKFGAETYSPCVGERQITVDAGGRFVGRALHSPHLIAMIVDRSFDRLAVKSVWNRLIRSDVSGRNPRPVLLRQGGAIAVAGKREQARGGARSELEDGWHTLILSRCA